MLSDWPNHGLGGVGQHPASQGSEWAWAGPKWSSWSGPNAHGSCSCYAMLSPQSCLSGFMSSNSVTQLSVTQKAKSASEGQWWRKISSGGRTWESTHFSWNAKWPNVWINVNLYIVAYSLSEWPGLSNNNNWKISDNKCGEKICGLVSLSGRHIWRYFFPLWISTKEWGYL